MDTVKWIVTRENAGGESQNNVPIYTILPSIASSYDSQNPTNAREQVIPNVDIDLSSIVTSTLTFLNDATKEEKKKRKEHPHRIWLIWLIISKIFSEWLCLM